MPKNLEVKIRVNDFENILTTLDKLKVKKDQVLNQSDIYYENDKTKVKLRIENGVARLIKYNRNETGENRWSNYEIMNLQGSDARIYFSDLMNEKTIVTKKRRLFLYKNTRIHLDEVEQLGKFIELESIVVNNDEAAKAEFYEIVDLLKLNLNEQIKCGYKELVELL